MIGGCPRQECNAVSSLPAGELLEGVALCESQRGSTSDLLLDQQAQLRSLAQSFQSLWAWRHVVDQRFRAKELQEDRAKQLIEAKAQVSRAKAGQVQSERQTQRQEKDLARLHTLSEDLSELLMTLRGDFHSFRSDVEGKLTQIHSDYAPSAAVGNMETALADFARKQTMFEDAVRKHEKRQTALEETQAAADSRLEWSTRQEISQRERLQAKLDRLDSRCTSLDDRLDSRCTTLDDRFDSRCTTLDVALSQQQAKHDTYVQSSIRWQNERTAAWQEHQQSSTKQAAALRQDLEQLRLHSEHSEKTASESSCAFAQQLELLGNSGANLNLLTEEVSTLQHGLEAMLGNIADLDDASRAQSKAWQDENTAAWQFAVSQQQATHDAYVQSSIRWQNERTAACQEHEQFSTKEAAALRQDLEQLRLHIEHSEKTASESSCALAHQLELLGNSGANLNLLTEEVSTLKHGLESMLGNMADLDDVSRAQSKAWREPFAEVKAAVTGIQLGLGLPESEQVLWLVIRGLLKQHRAFMQKEDIEQALFQWQKTELQHSQQGEVERSTIVAARKVVLSFDCDGCADSPGNGRQSEGSCPSPLRRSTLPALDSQSPRSDGVASVRSSRTSRVRFKDLRDSIEGGAEDWALGSVALQFQCLETCAAPGRGETQRYSVVTGAHGEQRGSSPDAGTDGNLSSFICKTQSSETNASTVEEQFAKMIEIQGHRESAELKDFENAGVESAQAAQAAALPPDTRLQDTSV